MHTNSGRGNVYLGAGVGYGKRQEVRYVVLGGVLDVGSVMLFAFFSGCGC